MAYFIHDIQNYRLTFVHRQNGPAPTPHSRTRIIELTGQSRDGNESSRVNLVFVTDAKSASTGETTMTSANGYRVEIRIPFDEFAVYYDIVRNEKPASLRVDFLAAPDLNQTVPNKSFYLFTGYEPLGEGPQDTSE